MKHIKVENSENTILITSYNDSRIIPLLKRLEDYNMKEILIADGGSNEELLLKIREFTDERIRLIIARGSVAESREKVRMEIRGKMTIFLDTDEFPTETWLEEITKPIIEGKVDFCFGPTIPLKPPKSRIERFVNDYDREFYEKLVKYNPYMGPMGNSAWRTSILKNLEFDVNLSRGGEDYDFNLKALSSGYKGGFAPDARLYHDQSDISTLIPFLRKKFRYMIGAAIAYRKNHVLRSRVKKSKSPTILTSDPLEFILIIMKPFALIVSLIRS